MSNPNFPSDFVWGVATSAYQIEGAVNEDGRGKSIWDTFSHTPGNTLNGDTGDVACDHYHRWEQDIELIAGLGVDAYRFSTAWPRIQPAGQGPWNAKGLDFYERLVDALLAKNIAPHLTLYHWDLPQALQDAGGWANRDTALRFADYAVHVATRLGDRLASIATHNEPWCTTFLGNLNGQFAPGIRDLKTALQVSHHLLLSHGLALQAMRAAGVRTPLGIVLNQSPAMPATDSAADRALAEREYARFVRWFMDPLFLGRYPAPEEVDYPADVFPVVHENDFRSIGVPLDFLGVNYYTRIWASTDVPGRPAPHLQGVSDMGWEVYPQGLTDLLTQIDGAYSLPPVYITENGMANADRVVAGKVDDYPRIAYIKGHIEAVAAARARGVDVRGFFYWSLLDNYEWNSGYAKRFGLIHVDYATQKRLPKESAHWYRNFIGEARREAGAAIKGKEA